MECWQFCDHVGGKGVTRLRAWVETNRSDGGGQWILENISTEFHTKRTRARDQERMLLGDGPPVRTALDVKEGGMLLTLGRHTVIPVSFLWWGQGR